MPTLYAKFAPRNPKTRLLFIGQDNASIDEYVSAVAADFVPTGFTTYSSIQDPPSASLLGLSSPVDFGTGPLHAQELVNKFPNSMLAIGLYLVDKSGTTLTNIANGTHNNQLDALAAFIKSTNRPVFLRIGYEFDWPSNHYEPDHYIGAFRMIVNYLRNTQKVSNFVSVWQSATSGFGSYEGRPILDWWPGADVVDWIGMSYFEYYEPAWTNLAAVAQRYGKPVLVCESTPQGFDIANRTIASTGGSGSDARPLTQVEIWTSWFQPFFDFVNQNRNIIRGVAYISCNWNAQPMWGPNGGNGYWGDSRVNTGSEILRRWNAEIARENSWLRATSALRQHLVLDHSSVGDSPAIASVGGGPSVLPIPTRKPLQVNVKNSGDELLAVGPQVLTAPYAPQNPETRLLFIGQDVSSIKQYASSVAMGARACGVATYSAIQEPPNHSLFGLTSPVDYGAGLLHANELLRQFPGSMLSIGLDIVERNGAKTLANISIGKHDEQLDILADFILSTKRAVFLRIGYEFDAKWNHYEPTMYKNAYRKIVTHLRDARGVRNFVAVWQSANDIYGTFENRPISDWWPGDDVVDWLGGSYYVFEKDSWDNLLSSAMKAKKPILVCQAAPQGFDITGGTFGSANGSGSDVKHISYSDIWEQWFAPFFAYLNKNKHAIRGVTYINCNWNDQPMWRPGSGHGYYGDSRVSGNYEIRRRWEAEITQSKKWLHASDRLGEFVFPPRIVERSTVVSKYTPRNQDKRLFFIGRDVDSIMEYVANMARCAQPDGFTTYTCIQDPPSGSLPGLDASADLGGGKLNARILLANLPQAAMSIRLDIADRSGTNLKHIVDGTHDHHLDALARFILSAGRPVFLSVGYHFDAQWLKYEPHSYIRAFRKIVIYLRVSKKVTNFVSVWQSTGGSFGSFENRSITDWWPGDDVVDWIGTSYFSLHIPSWKAVAAMSRKHKKPIFICEAAPQGYDIVRQTVAKNLMTGADARKVSAEEIWSLWYAPFFAFLNKNKHIIRAISYTTCNRNRNDPGMAGAGFRYWGDSRLTANSFIKKRWELEMGRPGNWLQPSDKILDAIILPEPSGRKVLSGKYAPRNPNSSLFCLGQDLECILDYATNISMGGSPSGVITYTAIQAPPGFAVPGLQSSINCGSGLLHAAGLLNVFPKSILVIGLDLVERNSAGTIEKLVRGELDSQLDELAAFLISADRPVFLRVGYQFDSRWNRYNPAAYKAAFRKIVTHLRHVQNVRNFASVWQSATSVLGTHENRPISDWWPGEDVVDWIGGAYFQYHSRSWQQLLDFAKQTRKPVMICEAAPHGIDLGRSTIAVPDVKLSAEKLCLADTMWSSWFAKFFSFIRENAHIIRGISYINCNWKAHPLWQPEVCNLNLGDSRLSMNPEIVRRWEAEITQSPTWLHASDNLMALIEQ